MKRRRRKKAQPVSRAKKRLIIFTIRLCVCALILGGIMIGNHFSGYPSEFVRKTLRESTDPSGISEKATEVFMQIYPK